MTFVPSRYETQAARQSGSSGKAENRRYFSIVETARSDRTRQWLTAHDLTMEGDPEQAARDLIDRILEDADLDPAGRLEMGLGLLELLEQYWITVELRWFVNGAADEAIWAAHWQAYREYLEEAVAGEAVLHSLWSDWFEDIDTVERAFGEVLGNDAGALAGGDERLLRRAAAVLRVTGPVPWRIKHPVYVAAAEVERLRPAVFAGILYSHHDLYGSLEIAPALELLDRLGLPDDTEHLADLRAALTEGYANRRDRKSASPPR